MTSAFSHMPYNLSAVIPNSAVYSASEGNSPDFWKKGSILGSNGTIGRLLVEKYMGESLREEAETDVRDKKGRYGGTIKHER